MKKRLHVIVAIVFFMACFVMPTYAGQVARRGGSFSHVQATAETWQEWTSQKTQEAAEVKQKVDEARLAENVAACRVRLRAIDDAMKNLVDNWNRYGVSHKLRELAIKYGASHKVREAAIRARDSCWDFRGNCGTKEGFGREWREVGNLEVQLDKFILVLPSLRDILEERNIR